MLNVENLKTLALLGMTAALTGSANLAPVVAEPEVIYYARDCQCYDRPSFGADCHAGREDRSYIS